MHDWNIVGDKKLLPIVTVLINFCTMLLGAKVHIHIKTNHLNIAAYNTTPDCVICWLNYVEQYNPHIHFLAKTMSLLTLSHVLINSSLNDSILSKGDQIVVLKDSISKEIDFVNDLLHIACFHTYLHWWSISQIQWIITRFL